MKKFIKNLLRGKYLSEFLIKQYEENWKYIRHIEEVRLKHMHLYIIFTGGILTVIGSIIFSRSNKPIYLDELITGYFFVLLFILFVIYIYGLFLIIFLIKQKKGYDMYVQKNKNIEKYFLEDYKIENLKSKFTKDISPLKKTFFYWLAIVIAIHSAFFSLMIYISVFFLMKDNILSFMLSFPSFFFNFILLSLIYKNNY